MLGHLHMCHGQKVDKLFVLRDDHQFIFIAVIASHTPNINGHYSSWTLKPRFTPLERP